MDVMRKKVIPSQEETDFNDPEEHFLWALRAMPMVAGSGLLTSAVFLRRWSKHLWDAGFAHRDYLERLADENGNIHVSKLPKQTTFFQEAFRGPQHTYNPAARWVAEHERDVAPKPFTVPNTREMTIQEKYALAYQLEMEGIRIPDQVKPPTAEEFN